MEVDRPGPGEELNPGAATRPREAATVIVLRGGAETLEVLLVKRNPEQRFMGGAWVFPGGAVDAGEGEGDAAHRLAGGGGGSAGAGGAGGKRTSRCPARAALLNLWPGSRRPKAPSRSAPPFSSPRRRGTRS